MYQPQKRLAFLIGGCPIPINLIMPHGIVILPASIAGVALYGVDDTVLHLLHDAHMVRNTVLRPGIAARIVPIKENQIAGARFIAVVLPKSPVLEPLGAGDTPGKLWDHACVNIPALIGTPTDKAGAPLHMVTEDVPRPLRRIAYVPKVKLLENKYGHLRSQVPAHIFA